ncbi:MAG: acyltransferase family protein [Isosphaeraceae bacterium]|nr:acyltransferase family protein [Isosphaeraceae bacterium]
MITALDPLPAAVVDPSPVRRTITPTPPAPAAILSANLGFLRALAVALVVQPHLFAYFGKPALWVFESSELGTLGVALFFVHTSLVLLQSLDQQHRSLGDRHFYLYLTFLMRRIFRIYPQSIVCVLLIAGLLIAAFQILQSLSLRGYHFELVGPFALAVVTNLLLVEFHLYLVLPVLYLVVRKMPTTGPIVAMWAVAALAVIVTGPRFAKHNAGWAVFRLPSLNYAPCFLAGVLAYKISEGRTGFVPFVGLPAFRELQSRRLRAACAIVARYSYGIYRSHYFCIWFAFEAMGGLGLAARGSIFLAGAAGLPVLLHHLIEAPMIRLGNRPARFLCAPGAACPVPPRGQPARAMARWEAP